MNSLLRNWKGLLLCCLAGVVWEVVARLQLVSPRLLPPLSSVVLQLVELTFSGVLPRALGATLLRMGGGLLAATALMIPLGIWAGRAPRMWQTIAPTVESLRALPPVLVILPAMLVLGIGNSMKIFAVFFAASFPIFLNTMDGVKSIPPLYVDTARTLRAGRFSLLFEVIVPAAAPGMLSGLRTAIPIAFIIAIVSEIIGGTTGIGHYLMRMQRTFAVPQMYAAVVAAALTGGLLTLPLKAVESLWLAWYSGWKRVSGSSGAADTSGTCKP